MFRYNESWDRYVVFYYIRIIKCYLLNSSLLISDKKYNLFIISVWLMIQNMCFIKVRLSNLDIVKNLFKIRLERFSEEENLCNF